VQPVIAVSAACRVFPRHNVLPHPEYPPEQGRYLRGNDFSPAAVIIILTYDAEAIPPEIENLVRAGAEAGAALCGTLQTADIGIEKIICNIVANPAIRYLILGGPVHSQNLPRAGNVPGTSRNRGLSRAMTGNGRPERGRRR